MDLRLPLGCAAALALAACGTGGAAHPDGWLKGQTHLHSNRSHDSQTPPEEVARFYERHGYDFIVFTDHDTITRLPSTERMLILPGAELTQNLPTCDPPPASATEGCKLHLNALFADGSGPVELPPAKSARRVDLYQRALDTARRLGAIAQLNHPTEARAVDPALMVELARRGVAFVEIGNQGHAARNGRQGLLPGTEDLWDAALTAGADVWGVASDDAHFYDDADAARARGEVPAVGDRGWVMVHARRDPAAIRDAIARGDFYATTGSP